MRRSTVAGSLGCLALFVACGTRGSSQDGSSGSGGSMGGGGVAGSGAIGGSAGGGGGGGGGAGTGGARIDGAADAPAPDGPGGDARPADTASPSDVPRETGTEGPLPAQCARNGECEMLEGDYAKELAVVQKCSGATVMAPCQAKPRAVPWCEFCLVWANNFGTLSLIRETWVDAKCGDCPRACPTTACPTLSRGLCVGAMCVNR